MAANGDIMTTEIVDDSHAGLFGEQPGIGELPANKFARDVADRVAMEADDVRSFDRLFRQCAQKFGDRVGVVERDVAFDAGDFEQRNVVM